MNIVLGLFTLALEEFGKGLILKDQLTKPKKEFKIPIQLFGKGKGMGKAHKQKIERALNELPEDCRRFYPAVLIKISDGLEGKKIKVGPNREILTVDAGTGIFSVEDEDDVVFKEGNPEFDFVNDFIADSGARMRCFYVDWDDLNHCWQWGVSVSEKNMKYLISELKQKIDFIS